MTVEELIERLKQYPANAEVRIVWESTVNNLNDDLIYISKDGVVLLDGDGGNDKAEFISGRYSAKYDFEK